jgi:hypothetical protein
MAKPLLGAPILHTTDRSRTEWDAPDALSSSKLQAVAKPTLCGAQAALRHSRERRGKLKHRLANTSRSVPFVNADPVKWRRGE